MAGTQIKTREGSKNIEDIRCGDYVLAEDPETGELAYKEVVYNFEVADFHTYFVSELGVLVHNMCRVGDKSSITRSSHAPA